MNKLIKRLAMLSVGLTMAIGAGIAAFGYGKGEVNNVVMAAEDDSHSIDDFTGKDVGVLLNNGAAPDTIELADQGYPVKQVVIGWKHNKSNDGVTATVTVGGDELGSGKVGGQNATTTTTIGDGSLSLSGAITISFSNSMTGTGKGTLYLKTLALIEGASGSLTNMSIFNSSDDETPFELDYGPTGMLLYARESVSSDDLDVDWTTSDATILDIEEIENDHLFVKGLKPGTATVSAEREGYKKATATITVSAGDLETIVVSGAMSKTSYSTMESWSAAGLVATANYELGYSYDATEDVEWTFNPAAPAENVTSVVATATMDEVSGSSAAQAVTVTVAHAGTAADPFTVAEAIAKCEEIGNVSGGKGPWVTTGIISQVVQVLTSGYQNARAYITADGKTTSPSVYVYDFKYLENAGFTEETAANIVVGATITVTGNLMNYNNNTPEYARGGYLLDIEAPETGDVDVTFNPASTSFEVGATGTFTASSETSGATFSWAVDDDTVLSVNESTGAYQALKTGVARVTVTASAGGKEGHTFVDFTVNGAAGSPLTVAEAVTLAASLDNGKTTSYYVYVEGYVKEFATSMKDSKPRAFDIMSGDEASRIMVYTNVDPYTDFVSDLALGHYVKVKANVQNYSGTYELTNPEKISSAYSALSLAYELLSLTDEFCDGYDGVTDNKSLVVSAWETLSGATKYGSLSAAEIAKLVEADAKEESKGGTILEQAMARYDYLNDKYELEGFIEGRGGSGSVENRVEINNNNSLIVVIAVISAVSLVALSTLLVLKKKHK